MKPIQQVVRTGEVRADELKHWAEKEVQPVLRLVREFCNRVLGSGELSVGMVVNDEWQPVGVGALGGELPDADTFVDVTDGTVRTIHDGALTGNRVYTLSAFGPSHRQGLQIWKFDTSSGFTATVSAGADSMVLQSDKAYFVECVYDAGAASWSILRWYELTID